MGPQLLHVLFVAMQSLWLSHLLGHSNDNDGIMYRSLISRTCFGRPAMQTRLKPASEQNQIHRIGALHMLFLLECMQCRFASSSTDTIDLRLHSVLLLAHVQLPHSAWLSWLSLLWCLLAHLKLYYVDCMVKQLHCSHQDNIYLSYAVVVCCGALHVLSCQQFQQKAGNS